MCIYTQYIGVRTSRYIISIAVIKKIQSESASRNMAPTIINVYVVCTLATIGGLLQGFDVSSLSAIIATPQVS